MSTRRKAREAALQMLFLVDQSGQDEQDAAAVIDQFWNGLSSSSMHEDTREFADRLVLGFCAHRQQVDDTIRGASTHWRLERMARVDRNVIRVAVYELLRCPDIPRRVSINEAIEVAKRFGDEGSSSFVNGILDRIAVDAGKE